MDDQLTLGELNRLEAERRLRSIPAEVLESAWVREAQVEAVIDAVVAVAYGEAEAVAHARHVGEWCARISGALSFAPDPMLARRVGVLADVDPAALERIAELRHLAKHVADYQRMTMASRDGEALVLSLVVAVASEFDERIADGRRSAASVLRAMQREATPLRRAIVEALAHAAAHPKSEIAVA